jgi:acid phosphatase (class A)
MRNVLKSILLVVALASSSCSICWADQASQQMANPSASPSSSDGPPEKPYYLTGKEDAWREFPPKPALGSAIDQEDLLITLSLQNSRTEDQKNEALRDKSYTINLMTDVIDSDFETKYPNIFKVLSNADIDSYFINTMIKKANGRLRPFVQHPTLVVPMFVVADFSYPSGHATGMELQARILAQLFPDKSDALLRRARQVADSRVVAGVHYASDTEAGLALGDLLYTEMAAKIAFQKDLATAAQTDRLAVK